MRNLLPATLIALALVPATPAAAAQPTPGQVTATGVQFLYAARLGEENHVVVTQTGNYVTLSDSGSNGISITAGSTCTQNSSTSISCATAPGWVLGIDVGNGDDTVSVDSTLGAEILGGNGDDVLDGGDGADLIGGQNGDDVIRGDGGADILGGNEGDDTIDYSTSLQPVTVTPDANADDGALGEGDFVQDTFENVRGSANGDDLTANANGGTVDGGAGADTLRGGPGVDVLNGGDGDDRILSLDGLADQLTCGNGADSAIADELDVVAGDCESVAYPLASLPADDPAAGDDGDDNDGVDTPKVAAVVGERTQGKVLVTVGGKTRELKADEAIPPSAVVDTRQGAITLSATPDAQGKVAKATFHGGQFRVQRSTDAQPITELSLAGPALSCTKTSGAKARAAKAGKPRTRLLWGSGHGRFRTRGKYASAAVRGTIWLTEDRCDGTLVRVKRGLVAVRDLKRSKTVMVPVGKQYLARAR